MNHHDARLAEMLKDDGFSVAFWRAKSEVTQAELDRMRRLFNRLEAAVSHHRAANHSFMTNADESLYNARNKILKDYSNGKG